MVRPAPTKPVNWTSKHGISTCISHDPRTEVWTLTVNNGGPYPLHDLVVTVGERYKIRHKNGDIIVFNPNTIGFFNITDGHTIDAKIQLSNLKTGVFAGEFCGLRVLKIEGTTEGQKSFRQFARQLFPFGGRGSRLLVEPQLRGSPFGWLTGNFHKIYAKLSNNIRQSFPRAKRQQITRARNNTMQYEKK